MSPTRLARSLSPAPLGIEAEELAGEAEKLLQKKWN